jgi:hypothetical protein
MGSNGWFISSFSAIELIQEFDNALKNYDLSNSDRSKIESLKQRLNENDNDLLFIREMIWNV